MAKAQQTQQNGAKKAQLPLRKTGVKQPPPDLAEFIRLANLVPDGEWLPPDLIPNLGSTGEIDVGTAWPELLERLHELPWEEVREELFAVSKIEPSPEKLTWASRDVFRLSAVLMHYERIRIAYYNLRGLTQDSIDPLNQLLIALGNADLSYLKRCPKADCGKLFYAGKHTQAGCSPDHSNAIRQQRKRDRDKDNRHPKKRAKTASKR